MNKLSINTQSGLPQLPAPYRWSARQVMNITLTNTQTSAQAFYLGNDSGTNSGTTGTLTIGGTFGTTTNSVIQAMSRTRRCYIKDIKIVGTGTSADTITPAQNVGLTLARTSISKAASSKIFDNTDVSTRQDQQTNIFPWNDVNWQFMGEDQISGTVGAADSGKNIIITLTIGYYTILGK